MNFKREWLPSDEITFLRETVAAIERPIMPEDSAESKLRATATKQRFCDRYQFLSKYEEGFLKRHYGFNGEDPQPASDLEKVFGVIGQLRGYVSA